MDEIDELIGTRTEKAGCDRDDYDIEAACRKARLELKYGTFERGFDEELDEDAFNVFMKGLRQSDIFRRIGTEYNSSEGFCRSLFRGELCGTVKWGDNIDELCSIGTEDEFDVCIPSRYFSPKRITTRVQIPGNLLEGWFVIEDENEMDDYDYRDEIEFVNSMGKFTKFGEKYKDFFIHEAGHRIGRAEEEAFIRGSHGSRSAECPTNGLLSNSVTLSDICVTGNNKDFARNLPEKLASLFYNTKISSRKNATWLMHPNTLSFIRSNADIWNSVGGKMKIESDGTYAGIYSDTEILGRPVVTSEFMPDIYAILNGTESDFATDKNMLKFILFGDFGDFLIFSSDKVEMATIPVEYIADNEYVENSQPVLFCFAVNCTLAERDAIGALAATYPIVEEEIFKKSI